MTHAFSRILARFSWASTLVAAALNAAPEPAELPLLTSLAEVHALSTDLARRQCPVRFTATVLYCDLEWRLLFLVNETSATFVLAAGLTVEPKSGDTIELQAVTTADSGGVSLTNPVVRVLGKGTLPSATRLSAGELQHAGSAAPDLAAAADAGIP